MKLNQGDVLEIGLNVAPYVGAWVETGSPNTPPSGGIVAPYVGAWVETKYIDIDPNNPNVAPYVGAWVETIISSPYNDNIVSRTLRGCVG